MKKWFATGIAFLVNVNSFCAPNDVPRDASAGAVYPFVPGSKVNAIATYKDTMYVGGIPGNMIYCIPLSSEAEISSYMESDPVALPKHGIKQIVADNDYLYVCTRGNGSGMITERKYPVFLAAFEEGYDFGIVKQNDCTVSISEQHCPSPSGERNAHLNGLKSAPSKAPFQSIPPSV